VVEKTHLGCVVFLRAGVLVAGTGSNGGTRNCSGDNNVKNWCTPVLPCVDDFGWCRYGSGDQATFGFSNLALFNGTMTAFLQSFFD
jgi:hypothetical protein